MIDYFKLLEVDVNSTIAEITEKYYEKIEKLQQKNHLEFAMKRRWYENAYLTLINNTNNRMHRIELNSIYKKCNITDTETKIFSADYEKNKQIIKKVESAIIDHLLLDHNVSFEESFSIFASKFGRNNYKDLCEIDRSVYVSTDNLLPYFCNCYKVVKNIEIQDTKQKKMTITA